MIDMKLSEKKTFLQNSTGILGQMWDGIDSLPVMKLSDLNPSETVLVIVDMINGFVREGALKSSRVEDLIPAVLNLTGKCEKRGIKRVIFSDCHTEDSPELESYPPHCMRGTWESEIVDELKELKGFTAINKNSTNGFLEQEFVRWMEDNSAITNFIIAGDCTDICVLQFTETLKAYFNMKNRRSNIIVPLDCVDTFDGGLHNADLMNVFSVFSMMGNGIKVVKYME
jgi:nicotinamidase-related amidase